MRQRHLQQLIRRTQHEHGHYRIQQFRFQDHRTRLGRRRPPQRLHRKQHKSRGQSGEYLTDTSKRNSRYVHKRARNDQRERERKRRRREKRRVRTRFLLERSEQLQRRREPRLDVHEREIFATQLHRLRRRAKRQNTPEIVLQRQLRARTLHNQRRL